MATPKFQLKVARKAHILDFDCEARPLSWINADYVSKELTAIAWKFIGSRDPVEVRLLGDVEPEEMIEDFRAAYNKADIVTGHYIRGFDLPLLNGSLIDLQLPILEPKLAQDTKDDLVKFAGISKSQENLAAGFDLHRRKAHMHQAAWRDANRLTTSGLEEARRRVTSDVKQHIELRAKLLRLGYLGPPRLWTPDRGRMAAYVP